MDKKIKINLIIFISFIVASLLFTILLSTVDVRSSINNPRLGFASINENVFYGLGQSKLWYIITQIIGYLAILVMVTFAVIGIIQLMLLKKYLFLRIHIHLNHQDYHQKNIKLK